MKSIMEAVLMIFLLVLVLTAATLPLSYRHLKRHALYIAHHGLSLEALSPRHVISEEKRTKQAADRAMLRDSPGGQFTDEQLEASARNAIDDLDDASLESLLKNLRQKMDAAQRRYHSYSLLDGLYGKSLTVRNDREKKRQQQEALSCLRTVLDANHVPVVPGQPSAPAKTQASTHNTNGDADQAGAGAMVWEEVKDEVVRSIKSLDDEKLDELLDELYESLRDSYNTSFASMYKTVADDVRRTALLELADRRDRQRDQNALDMVRQAAKSVTPAQPTEAADGGEKKSQ